MNAPKVLMQEELLDQPDYGWRMLVACTLLRKTRAGAAAPVLERLFEIWPTPGLMAKVDPSKLTEVPGFSSLGLTTSRSETLVAISERCASGRDPREAWGVGAYARDSWAIFVEGRRDVRPTDLKLRAYLAHPRLWMIDKAYAHLKLAEDSGREADWNRLFTRFVCRLSGQRDVSWEDFWADALRSTVFELDGRLYKTARMLGDKNLLYGEKAICLSGRMGLVSRCVEKLCRIENMEERGLTCDDEPVRDTWSDLCNYAVLGILMERKQICAD